MISMSVASMVNEEIRVNPLFRFIRNTGFLLLIYSTSNVLTFGKDTQLSDTYVTPIEDTLILTPSPKESSWVKPMMSYPCIGKADTGWLIIYTDSQGERRTGLVPWRERMGNITADDLGDEIRIRPGTVARITQGGILLKKDIPYRLLAATVDQQKVQYFKDSFTQEVYLARSKLRPIMTSQADSALLEGESDGSPEPAAKSTHFSPQILRDKTLWGLSKANVKALETSDGGMLLTSKPDFVTFKTAAYGHTCIAAYSFTNGLLAGKDIAFALPARKDLTYFPDDESYVQEYTRLRNILKKEYGAFIEQQQVTGIATATSNKYDKVKAQQEQVAFLTKQITLLQRKQKREMDAILASAPIPKGGDDVFSNPQNTQRDSLINELKTVQAGRMEYLAKDLLDAKTKLKIMVEQEPITGWASYTSQYTANNCKISLECHREADGIRLFMKYRPLLESQIQPMLFTPPVPDSTSSNSNNSSTITTTKGIKYSSCAINRVEPDGLIVSSSKGISKILFADLPESYREKYGYDAKKAATYVTEKREKQVALKLAQEDKGGGDLSAQDAQKIADHITAFEREMFPDYSFNSSTIPMLRQDGHYDFFITTPVPVLAKKYYANLGTHFLYAGVFGGGSENLLKGNLVFLDTKSDISFKIPLSTCHEIMDWGTQNRLLFDRIVVRIEQALKPYHYDKSFYVPLSE